MDASGIYTDIVSTILFPLQERIKGHSTVHARQSFERTQWWSAERLAELQLQRLREMLASVGQGVPYYRELFNSIAFRPEFIVDLKDLQRLPLLTKSEIRTHSDRMKRDSGRPLSRFNTGGSSGEPLVFFISKERISRDVAAKWRATRWWGVDIGDPEIVVWGSPIELGAQDRVRWFRDALMRTELLPAFEMSLGRLNEFLWRIRRRKPKMLFGYPSSLTRIAEYAESKGVRMDDLGIRVAFVTSERLYEDQRATISRVFGCSVANGYGGRDAGFIAHECPAGGMHVTAEDILIEIIDDNGVVLPPGESGEIVVTHLATQDFPFIRYRTGDIGAMGKARCSCGRGLPLLKEIQGRNTDFVVAADGTVMHGLALIYVLRDLPGIQAFKIIQNDLLHTTVQIVVATVDAKVDEAITSGLRRRLGAVVNIAVEHVSRIEPDKSGKFRYVVSKVDRVAAEDSSAPPRTADLHA